ncbi:MAG: hypothetical protein IT365_00450 [Candidatus Hydrogenedentes bacterium]|nr:hypothetical protein [Candidatus Hydrogenedentota bacterium]
MEVNRMNLLERMPRRAFFATLCVAVSIIGSGCGTLPGNLAGQIQWEDFGVTHSYEFPLNGVFGAAFLLLEEDYRSLGYEGPPKGHLKTTEAAIDWHRQMPEEWWSSSSIPHEWWGRQSGTEPAEVTLPLDVPVPLLRAHLDSMGRFEFNNLPRGRHTLFIRWGKNPDPQNNISGPYEVIVEKGGRFEQILPVSAFDMIDT